MDIKETINRIRSEIPANVTIVAAAKTRTVPEIEEAIDAGISDIGENYVQEAEKKLEGLGEKAKKIKWHMIGHLQTNKINKALQIFNVVQTIDSVEKALSIDKRARNLNKVVTVYIEVNIGNELSKSGIIPDYNAIEKVVQEISRMDSIRLEGIMTMGPFTWSSEKLRPYFRKTRELFEKIKSKDFKNVNMKTLSMGMSNSYKVAIEEGSTMIRLGTVIFGERKYH